jgi:ABC-2 type transport system permease protein
MRPPGANTLIVAQREYLSRLRSKGFWIATAALPIFLVAVGVLPSLLLLRTEEAHRLVIVDATGELGEAVRDELLGDTEPGARTEPDPQLDGGQAHDTAAFDVELVGEADRGELNHRVLEGEIDAWIRIDDEALAGDRVSYYAESVSNFLTQEKIERAVSSAARRWRLATAGYDADEVGELARSIQLVAVKVTEKGEEEGSVAAGIVLAYLLFFMLYMVLVIYGQQVMNGVLEEKSSRIVELIVATTRPLELMLGKLLGICSVALTQVAIWLATVLVLTLPSVVATMSWLPEGVTIPTLGPWLIVHLLINFLLGFFLFSTFYAAIGAAFNSVQEAQHSASLLVAFLVLPILLFWKVLNDPDGTISVVTSMIPLFTPLLMMLRIVIKTPPAWQIAVAYTLTAAFTWGMVWTGSRIYRVGILMYGKKPTFRELWRWVRYT